MSTPANAPIPPVIYGVFCGGIEQATAQRFVHSLTVASMNDVKSAHVLFQSNGGFLGDGVFLYNYFRSVPFELVVYNGGQLASAGVIAYLGAKKRVVSANANFMIHRTTNSPQFATSTTMEKLAKSLVLDDARTDAILRAHAKLPAELWAQFQYHDVYISAKEAVEYGMADEIGEFSPPSGHQVFNVLG